MTDLATDQDAELTRAVVIALASMAVYGPEPLLDEVGRKFKKSAKPLTEIELLDALLKDVNSRRSTDFHLALAKWDESDDDWTGGTPAKSMERRDLTLSLLGFSADAADQVNRARPPLLANDAFIVDPDWTPWYTSDRESTRQFYWPAYERVLRSRMDPTAVASIGAVTKNIVGRLADPSAVAPYQSKGLVVGHVQSGKTANFTGVIARAIDSGYRLIIVLTGTVELLRAQTQRRLDMELIGRQNILGGRDESDPSAMSDVDYAADGDMDWLNGKFLTHDLDPAQHRDIPSIVRLTGKSVDYKNLAAGLNALDFRGGHELADPKLPVWHTDNLFGTDVRIAVVKKNKTVLTKLVQDLRNTRNRLDEIPALIIDDEADQASVNTTNPNRQKIGDDIERTAINKLIAQLLGELKRSQYVGYTATPFANVFVSPDDSEDIFPKDFIVSLDPPAQYMGGRDFHDLDGLPEAEGENPEYSNEAAFIRALRALPDTDDAWTEMRIALDFYVLSGAIKLWRKEAGFEVSARHHTMLVHESVRKAEHRDLATAIRRVWSLAGYSTPGGLARLRTVYEEDVVPVSTSRPWDAPLPESFDDLRTHIGEAVNKITNTSNPVVVVNGDKDADYEQIDFDRSEVWRVLVGGTKLSRGFTIEGLTVSYYRRRALQADTLMQMGRWFGYRPGYRDLVRLFISRNAPAPRGRTVDLYEAFQSIVEDEEEFRAQLVKFAQLDEDGNPQVRPSEVPPLVFQQLPWLKPTAASKMYNAELQFLGEGGVLKDYPRQPARGTGKTNKKHFDLVVPWVDQLSEAREFEYVDPTTQKIGKFHARTAIVGAEDVLKTLARFEWGDDYDFGPTLAMMKKAVDEDTLVDWAVLVPYLGTVPTLRTVGEARVPILKRSRRADRTGFSGSSFRQRDAIQHIAGSTPRKGGANAEALREPTRGAILLTFAADNGAEKSDPTALPDPARREDVATLFSLALPHLAAPRGRVGFQVRDKSKKGQPIVNVPF